ncbi:MAG: MerR family transcriptional regulator [Nannocystaceae bacterium]|nr:MerR family transcriptional regulator [Nannocystaceae bacterium]
MSDETTSVLSARGRYRIQTVAELTGVPASTLRAWEQRYGFPAPERTASAYRLYTDADVARIARVRALCEGGLAAAEAVAAVMAEAAAEPPRIEPARARVSQSAAPRRASATPADDATALDAIEQRVRKAMLVASPAEVLAQVIEPQWAKARQGWLDGTLDRGAQRLLHGVLEHAVLDLVRLGQPARPLGDAALGCFADDDDCVPLAAVALACQAAGLRVRWLGARTSPGIVADVVAGLAPRVVALCCVDAPAPARARELVTEYAHALGGQPWLLAGPGATALAAVAARAGAQPVPDATALAAALAAWP